MSWFNKLFTGGSRSRGGSGNGPEEIVQFYQGLGFFASANPAEVLGRYQDEHGGPPDPAKPWDDVFLLAYSEGGVWADDPEADVCAENQIYTAVLRLWAAVSQGAFVPENIAEHWEGETGPITLRFTLNGETCSLAPSYQDDWLDLAVLQQLNRLIASSGRQFECAVDGNFALVLCLTPEQKVAMQTQRQFPFAW